MWSAVLIKSNWCNCYHVRPCLLLCRNLIQLSINPFVFKRNSWILAEMFRPYRYQMHCLRNRNKRSVKNLLTVKMPLRTNVSKYNSQFDVFWKPVSLKLKQLFKRFHLIDGQTDVTASTSFVQVLSLGSVWVTARFVILEASMIVGSSVSLKSRQELNPDFCLVKNGHVI